MVRKRYHDFALLGYNERYYFQWRRGSSQVKPVNLNQLLFHPRAPTLSFFQMPFESEQDDANFQAFFDDMLAQLSLQDREDLVRILSRQKNSIRKVLKNNSENPHGFFLSETLQGYVVLESLSENFCMIGQSFHVRPLLEQIYVNPEFIIVNISLYDISVYKADFHHVDIIKHYEFDELPRSAFDHRVFAPQFMGLIPYRSLLAVKTIAQKVMETTQYHSYPVVVTGLDEMKKMFLKHFDHTSGVISHIEEDFFEKSCVEISERCRIFRPAIMDFYSAQLKERLKRMMKSNKFVTDLDKIIKAAAVGDILHLILPVERKLMGHINLATGEYEIHKKIQKKNPSVDILNELAEEVMKSGGKIQFLGPHFFPADTTVLAILRGN
jgi:hypothetical protein